MEFQQAKPSGAVLRWRGADGTSRLLPLGRFETVVGRHAECDLVIADQSVSREHAKVLRSKDAYLLVDLASINGTVVNGQRIRACQLRNGDRIQFGKNSAPIHFEQEAPTEADRPVDTPEKPLPIAVNPSLLEGLPPERVADILQVELRKSLEQRWGLHGELLLAEEIQQALLPQRLPDLDGFRVCAYAAPTRYVGGDFYDFIMPSRVQLIGVLGDISGKGVAASLLSSMALGCLETQLRSGASLEDAVRVLNVLLCEKGCGRFVTLFLFQLDSRGRGQFVSAGHNPAYIYRGETAEVTEVASNSPIVGAFETCVIQPETLELGRGDVLLVYSDGLTEAQNASGEMLGEDPVRRIVQERSTAGAETVKASLLDLLVRFTEGHKQSDDVTFIILERV